MPSRVSPGGASVEGVDAQRAGAYRVWAAAGFEWEGLPYPLRIARVGEEPLTGPHRGKTPVFSVLTTEESLSARDLRELAHHRWLLEHKGFKSFNEQCPSQHAFVRDPKAMVGLLLLLFLAFALVQASRLEIEALKEARGVAAAGEQVAFRFLRQLFWLSLGRGEGAGVG